MGTTRLTCREFVRFLDDYVSGRLATSVRRRFEVHLATCPACEAYKTTFETAVRLGRLAMLIEEADALLDDAPEELVNGILAIREERE